MELTKIQSHNLHFINLERINDDSVMVDAGAYLGLFEENIRLFPQAKNCQIIILECNRDLKRMLEDKNLHNVTVIGKALSGQMSLPEKTFFQVIGLPDWGSVFNRRLNRRARKKCREHLSYPVKTIKINDIFSELEIEEIDYFKIDIMGAEREVVETMSREIALRIKQIDIKFYELTSGLDSKEGERKLIDLGFMTELVSQRQVYGRRE